MSNFKYKVEQSKKLIKKIKQFKKDGHKICGYGATSKSTTILIIVIKFKFIDFFDTTPDKLGSSPAHIFNFRLLKLRNLITKKSFYSWDHKKEIMKKKI